MWPDQADCTNKAQKWKERIKISDKTFIHSINQSINQSIKQSINQSLFSTIKLNFKYIYNKLKHYF